MKITYITNTFPKLSETFVLGQITGLIDRGHDVEIISIAKPTENTVHEDIKNYNLLEKTHYINKSPSFLGFKPDEKLISSLIFTDILHAHFAAYPAAWALEILRTYGVPFVITTHAYDIYINPDIEDLREKFGNAEGVITTTDYNKDYLSKLLGKEFGDSIEIIRYGIDTSTFSFIERRPDHVVKILYIGRLVEKKGPSYAIEAFDRVLNEDENAELRMIGDGPLRDDLKSIIDRLNLRDKVHLLGAQPQSRVLKEMEEADIFFLPSLIAENGDREGSPVSILEAQARGLPIVSTIHTGIPEIVIDGKTGFLVPEKDTSAMAEKLTKLILDPELRIKMGKAGRTHVEANFDRRKEIDALEKLFENVLENRPLVSDLAQDQGLPGNRFSKLATLLSRFDSEIDQTKKDLKLKDKEIGEKLKVIDLKDDQIKQLEGRLAEIESTLGYKIYTYADRFFKRISSRIKKVY